MIIKDRSSSIEFGTFEREIISEKIAGRLIALIREKQLRPGDRLPPERELAAQMGVSRPSLREALRALSIMGIIENRQGSGTYITALEPAQLVEHLDFILSLDDSMFLDFFEARRVLESGSAALAAQKINPEQIEDLETYLAHSEEAVSDPEAFLLCDMEIHRLISEAANNKILSLSMAVINKVGLYSRRRTSEYPDIRQKTLADHRNLIQAIKSRDPRAASRAMEEHLDHVEAKMRDILFSEKSGHKTSIKKDRNGGG